MTIYDVPKQPVDLRRFFEAQSQHAKSILSELSEGKKTSHWMWFVFPQIKGLGKSKESTFFAIQSIEHARQFIAHKGLANRLRYHTKLVLQHQDKRIDDIFPFPDSIKFQSSMTLFSLICPDDPLFQRALDTFFEGNKDISTLMVLSEEMGSKGQ
jgi:uncharacterized protein (DUF1810 family)